MKRARQAVGDGESLRRQIHGGSDQLRPRLPPIFLRCVFEAAHGTGHTGRAIAQHAVFGGLAIRSEIHIASRLAGSALAKIKKRGAAAGKANEHESAAADITGRRMRDGERQSHSDRRIHSVASGLQHRQSRIGGMRLACDHHGVARVHGLHLGADG